MVMFILYDLKETFSFHPETKILIEFALVSRLQGLKQREAYERTCFTIYIFRETMRKRKIRVTIVSKRKKISPQGSSTEKVLGRSNWT
jgi:hypothetical protein